MKITIILTAILLFCLPAFGKEGERQMPLAKKISAEKLLLAEKYENGLKTCRERTRKNSRKMCIEQQKKLWSTTMADLERAPKAYFAAQERNAKTEKDLQEADLRRPRL